MSALAGKPSKPESPHWAAVAEPQLCVIEALGIQLARVNTLLETSFNDLSTQFVHMAEDVAKLRHAEGENREALLETVERTLAKSIMSMQFQDRVSQNLVITMDVLRALASELESELASANRPARIDADAARELYHFLRLGEVRAEFLEAMTRRGFISGPQDLGVSGNDVPQGGEEDVELF